MADCFERDLVIAVLKRAVDDVQGDLTDVPEKDRTKIMRQAQKWFQSGKYQAFSFPWCCDVLGLDIGAVRERIRRQVDSHW